MAYIRSESWIFKMRILDLLLKHDDYYYIFKEYCNSPHNLSDSTLYYYLTFIIDFLETANKPLEELTLDDYLKYAEKHKKCSISSQRGKYYAIKKFVDYFASIKLIPTNFMDEVQLPQKIKKYSLDSGMFGEEILSEDAKRSRVLTFKLIEKNKEYKDVLEGFQRETYDLAAETAYYYILFIINFLDDVNKQPEFLTPEDYEVYAKKQLSLSLSNQVSKYSALKRFAEYLYTSKRNNINFMEGAEGPYRVKKGDYDSEKGKKADMPQQYYFFSEDEESLDDIIILEEDDDTL